jgi:asparagine synthase (glutamine-hydrolysing)
MCRIFGFLGAEKISRETLTRVSQLQIHGGPDQQTIFATQTAALGINRLAIQGMDGGRQPYQLSEHIHVVFNGEIYNAAALRKTLALKGYHFADSCDGNVIAPLYHEFGADFMRYLDGMFAIAILDDRETSRLTLATDPTGIKSLYYYWHAETRTLKFSSELAPLLALGQVNKRLRAQAIDEYLLGKSVWGPATMYEDIYCLPPASKLTAIFGQPPVVQSYQTVLDEKIASQDFIQAGVELNDVIEQEVASLMLADVPVCVVTSGGLDSSYLSALAQKYNPDLHSFNIWYEGEWPQDERHYAREVALRYNTTHHQILIKEKDFPALIQQTVRHLGQPNSAPHSLSTYVLFQEVRQAGFKVALTGEGADEFFGGYARFHKASQNPDAGWLAPYLDTLSAASKSLRDELYTADYQAHLHGETLYSRTLAKLSAGSDSNRLETLLAFDQDERFPYYILRRVDHLSMAHGVEVRVPFCQPRITALSRKLPAAFKHDKRILYQAAAGKLPDSVLTRTKQPFLLPISAMLKPGHILYDLLVDTLHSLQFNARNIFKKTAVDKLLQRQASHPSDAHAESLWALMTLELWLQATDNHL